MSNHFVGRQKRSRGSIRRKALSLPALKDGVLRAGSPAPVLMTPWVGQVVVMPMPIGAVVAPVPGQVSGCSTGKQPCRGAGRSLGGVAAGQGGGFAIVGLRTDGKPAAGGQGKQGTLGLPPGADRWWRGTPAGALLGPVNRRRQVVVRVLTQQAPHLYLQPVGCGGGCGDRAKIGGSRPGADHRAR